MEKQYAADIVLEFLFGFNKKNGNGMKENNELMMIAEGDTIRYALIKEGKRKLFVFGVNPSTATDKKSDPTMRKVKKFAENFGFDGYAMLNLYSLRCTKPYALPKEINEELHQKNLKCIKEVIGNTKNPVVLFAFGNPINAAPYLRKCFKDIVTMLKPLCPQWKQLGTLTKAGNPRHPSWAPSTSTLEDFDVVEFLGEDK